MTVLVTGAAGFIGSNFVRYWRSEHPDDTVVALDLLTYAGNRANLADVPDVPFVQGDIGDLDLVESVVREHGVDVVVNFAAESHNSLAVLDPARFMRTNAMATLNLLEVARRTGIERFHHISTCEVYGDMALDDPGAFTEDSPYRPRTPYNASKAAGDHIVRAYFETFHVPVTISNCCNNYGPYQYPEKVIPVFVTNLLDGQTIPVYESSANRREWLHVDDHCRAIDRILADGKVGETYNVGSGVERSVDEIADTALTHLGLTRDLVVTVPDRPGHDRRYLLSSDKIREQLGWEPTVEWADGIAETIQWYADNRDWWEPLKNARPVDEGAAWASTPAPARG